MNRMKKPADPRQKLVERGKSGSEVDFIECKRKARKLMPVTD